MKAYKYHSTPIPADYDFNHTEKDSFIINKYIKFLYQKNRMLNKRKHSKTDENKFETL